MNVTQVRIYTINKGKMEAFVQGWRQGVYPLRLKQSFKIPGAWVIEASNQFVWIISYDGDETWDAKEAAYYQSAERAALDPDPAQLIARAEQYTVRTIIPMGNDQSISLGQ